MPYNSTGLVVHDADAHIMETADVAARPRRPGDPRPDPDADLPAAATSCARPAIPTSSCATSTPRSHRLAERHRSAEYRDVEAAEIMDRKNFAATGSFLAEDRPRALDLLGFASQLVFNTFHNRRLRDWEHGGDLELRSARPAPTTGRWSSSAPSTPGCCRRCYVPLADLDRGRGAGRRGDRDGRRRAARRLRLPARPLAQPHRRSTRCGRRPARRGIPIVFHVGGTGRR